MKTSNGHNYLNKPEVAGVRAFGPGGSQDPTGAPS